MPQALLKESLTLLAKTDAVRKSVNSTLEIEKKNALAQYMTPASVSSFMASLFPMPTAKKIFLLDPGAGVGSLTSAFVANLVGKSAIGEIDVEAYEVDTIMHQHLEANLELCQSITKQHGGRFSWQILHEDFIIDASQKISAINGLWPEKINRYTHCIMNPPYKKISSDSRQRLYLRSIGIETVNLYSAFVAVALSLMEMGGTVVAIIPRSFCNGPYYRPFREFILKRSSVQHIHLFTARNKAFKEDNVLQENIIIMLKKGGRQQKVTVTTSTDDSFMDISTNLYPFEQIVQPCNSEMVVHIPTSQHKDFLNSCESIRFSLDEIGIQVSTGPVVDFRLKEHLRKNHESGAVPLLYPCHLGDLSINWPIENSKKPNAIVSNHETEKHLYPNGFYTVVRRFSSKEEKRRIVASVVDPGVFNGAELIGFENHLNVFHQGKNQLPETLARGLAIFLNSTIVDDNFRRFSGHTQVNATDLRLMKYPDKDTLLRLGNWALKQKNFSPNSIDDIVEKMTR